MLVKFIPTIKNEDSHNLQIYAKQYQFLCTLQVKQMPESRAF